MPLAYTTSYPPEWMTQVEVYNYHNEGSKHVLKHEQVIGNGTDTQFTITHNFGTRNVIIAVYRNSGDYDTVSCDQARPTTNTILLTFSVAPTNNQYVVVVLGQGE